MKGTISEGEVRHLPIDNLPPHPVIELLEKNNVFPIKEGEIETLTESVLNINLLQPIVVTEENGKFYRVAGRRRLLAAKKAGFTTIPCYIRKFSSEEEIVQAWYEENFTRAHYNDATKKIEQEKIRGVLFQSKIEEEKIEKIKNALDEETFQRVIKTIRDLPVENANLLIDLIAKPPKIVKEKVEVIDPELVKAKKELESKIKELESQIAEYKNKEKELNKNIQNYTEKISKLEREKEILMNAGEEANKEEIERLKKEIEKAKQEAENYKIAKETLQNKLKETEAKVAQKEREVMAVYEKLRSEIDTISNTIFLNIQKILENMKKDIDHKAESLSNLIPQVKEKDTLLVILDWLDKNKPIMINQLNKIEKNISDRILEIEKEQKQEQEQKEPEQKILP
jgi:ParB family chromosome partitioning protein